ncbi:MAG: S-layer homology domain-containing protein [Bacillota bacterium]|nr:S-layer homology domain-containing protein [Bacillota bacterium]
MKKVKIFILPLLALAMVLSLAIPLSAGELTNKEKIEAGYEKARSYYLENREFTEVWDAWTAYACLGQYIQDPANGYSLILPEETVPQKMQPGAAILAVIALGGNPYNYEGRDLVAELIERDPGWGIWSVPVYNALALEAAGAGYDEVPIDYCLGEMEKLDMGPDIGGWALVAVSRHLYDEYGAAAQNALNTFRNGLKERMWGNSTGSPGISMACVTLGCTALTAQGISGYDVTRDLPWVKDDPVGVMYDNYVLAKEDLGYTAQYRLAFADLYNVLYKNGISAWHDLGVDRTKLNREIKRAEAITAKPQYYTRDGVAKVENALSTAKAVSEERLSQPIADYGREYFDLYDAVRNVELSFKDTPAEGWYYSDVVYVVSQEIMKGVSDTAFDPNSSITRGQFLTILGRWAGIEDAAANAPVSTGFADVEPYMYYASHVAWGVEQGITNGVSADSFDPNANITRQDMAVMIARFAKVRNIDLDLGSRSAAFGDDSEIAEYAKDAVYAMKSAGIFNGKGNNKFEPRANATRAEAAKIIHKLMILPA